MEATHPSSSIDRTPTLKELVPREAFTDLCRSYVDLYGIGIKVFDADGTRLVDLKIGNGDFCGYVFGKGDGRQKCTATVGRVKDTPFDLGALLGKPVAEKFATQNCFTGLRYVTLPIIHEMDLLGKVIFGPFRPAELENLPESVTSLSKAFDIEQATTYIEKIRQAPDGTVLKIMEHFWLVLEVIIHAGYQAQLTSTMHIESVTESHRELIAKNRQLEESLEKLKELDRLKSNFLATVSHELRTPLTSVIGYSEMLLEGLAGDLKPEQIEYVRTIMEKGENLLQIISSILDISKIESGSVQLSLGEVDMAEVARAAISTVLPQAQRKELKLDTRLESALPRVPADRAKVRQCMVNLLANAVKFTPDGGTVILEVQRYTGPRRTVPEDPDGAFGLFEPRENHFVRVAVIDSGIGIPSDKLARVFDTFYQVDNSPTREYGGTGLGLSIVKSYIEAHGGEVRVDSNMGGGSTFAFLLPLEATTGVPLPPGEGKR